MTSEVLFSLHLSCALHTHLVVGWPAGSDLLFLLVLLA